MEDHKLNSDLSSQVPIHLEDHNFNQDPQEMQTEITITIIHLEEVSSMVFLASFEKYILLITDFI